jgi:hypothetical protein
MTSDQEFIKDVLTRCHGILSKVEYMRLSHWAWLGAIDRAEQPISYENDPEAQFLNLSDAPPIIWEGEAGTHPLVELLEEALKRTT